MKEMPILYKSRFLNIWYINKNSDTLIQFFY